MAEGARRQPEIGVPVLPGCAAAHGTRGQGSIVNIASFVAVMGSATSQISYTASKGGVLAMSRELGVQFARQGIRVNALCPGPVNTPLLQELFANDPERAARRMVHVPMGRFGEADEIAAVVAFLASDDASFITAATYLGRRRHQRRLHHPAVTTSSAWTSKPRFHVTGDILEATLGWPPSDGADLTMLGSGELG